MKVFKRVILGLTVGIFITACGKTPQGENNNSPLSSSPVTESTLDVTVSIPPQEYIVKKIGGDRTKVNTMVQPGDNLHVYEPKPNQLKALSEAEAYVTMGVSFESAWMDKIKSANPEMLIINSEKGINKIEMTEHEHDHNHGEENHNLYEETSDPHIWLSPELVKIQAENIYQGLSNLDPQNQEEYKKNLDQFITEIDNLNNQISKNLSGIKNRKFIVFHPAWGYFAQQYDLEQIPIELGGKEPSIDELQELINKAKTENIRVIFAQPEFSIKSAETIAKEINGEVILISPYTSDWSNNLLNVSKTFAEHLSK